LNGGFGTLDPQKLQANATSCLEVRVPIFGFASIPFSSATAGWLQHA